MPERIVGLCQYICCYYMYYIHNICYVVITRNLSRRFPVQERIFSVYIFMCVVTYYRRGNFSYVLLGLRQNIILDQFAIYLQTGEQARLNIHKMQVCSHENHTSIFKTFEFHSLSENLTLMEFPGVKSPWVLA